MESITSSNAVPYIIDPCSKVINILEKCIVQKHLVDNILNNDIYIYIYNIYVMKLSKWIPNSWS